MVAQTSPERETAQATYPAELRTVGAHINMDLDAPPNNHWLAKPKPGPGNLQATHLKLQALDQNVRYTIDESDATTTHGFQLTAGADSSPIPVPNEGVSVAGEAAGANIQGQWLR
jgi:hypothetical protein